MHRLVLTALATVTMSCMGSQAHAMIIDTLTTNPHATGGAPDSVVVDGSSITRTISATGGGFISLVPGSPGGAATFAALGDTVSIAWDLRTYDGSDPNNPNLTTPGGQDLSGDTVFIFDFSVAIPPTGVTFDYTVDIDGVATTYSLTDPAAPIVVPATYDTLVEDIIVTLELTSTTSLPVTLAFGNFVATAPEPTSLSFLGLVSCLGLGMRRRRKVLC